MLQKSKFAEYMTQGETYRWQLLYRVLLRWSQQPPTLRHLHTQLLLIIKSKSSSWFFPAIVGVGNTSMHRIAQIHINSNIIDVGRCFRYFHGAWARLSFIVVDFFYLLGAHCDGHKRECGSTNRGSWLCAIPRIL